MLTIVSLFISHSLSLSLAISLLLIHFSSSSSFSPSPPLSLSEYDIVKERIEKILGAGANVVLVSGGIDDLCLKYFVEAKAMGVRRCKKEDLKRIARATGGKE